MLDLGALRQGIADTVQAVTGLRMTPHQPDQLNMPCGWVDTGDPFMPEPYEAFKSGLCQIEVVVRVAGSDAAGFARGLAALDQYMGSGTGQTHSVLDAIHSDTSFGGVIPAGNVRVIEIGGPKPFDTMGGVTVIAVDIPVRIYVPRT